MCERDLVSELNELLAAKDAALLVAELQANSDAELMHDLADIARRYRDERNEAKELLAAAMKDRDEWKAGCIFSHEKRLEASIECQNINQRLAAAEAVRDTALDEASVIYGLQRRLATAEALLMELAIHEIRNYGRWTVGMQNRVRDVVGHGTYDRAKGACGE